MTRPGAPLETSDPAAISPPAPAGGRESARTVRLAPLPPSYGDKLATARGCIFGVLVAAAVWICVAAAVFLIVW